MQAGVPLAAVHTVAHAPQLLKLLVVAVSQPLVTLPSQLAKPAAQAMPHWPAEHEAVPCVVLQTLPHPPHAPVLVSVFVSQPFAVLPSQSAKGAVHEAIWQDPDEHDATAFGRLQAVPQVTQFALVFRLVSQPSAYCPLQSAKPALQLPREHVELAQAATPLATEHALPHEPQLVTLVVRFVSHPFAELPSQSPSPAEHVEIPHTPETQLGVPPVAEQT